MCLGPVDVRAHPVIRVSVSIWIPACGGDPCCWERTNTYRVVEKAIAWTYIDDRVSLAARVWNFDADSLDVVEYIDDDRACDTGEAKFTRE